MTTPKDTVQDSGQSAAFDQEAALQQIADLEAKLAAAQRSSAAPVGAVTGGPVNDGDVVLHDVTDHATGTVRTQALVVIGSKSIRVNPDDPDDTRRTTKVHAVPLGWTDQLAAVPKTYPVPLVAAGQFAELSQADYRRQ
jgi:hypothetical protein